ncbi:hypothetical protein TNCV_2316511 [Trichonephila clavipes]|nr:hypothetical protein TNCV_2316511 [Trichonephila clavipes]
MIGRDRSTQKVGVETDWVDPEINDPEQGKWQVAWNLRSSCPGNGTNKRWAGQILLEKTVADEVRSLMKELPCKLQYDWSRPINAESGRGNRLGRSGNKRPGTRRS